MPFRPTVDPVPFVDLVAQNRALKEEMVKAFEGILERAAFVGGKDVEGFESEFARSVGTRYVVGVSSGTDALRLALIAIGVGRGQRVITVPNTFIATTAAVSQVGAAFDFVDVDPATCLMDPNRLEDHLKRSFASSRKDGRPSAILPVHLYGQCAEMDAITGLAQRYEVQVLEDAAQAHGATHKGRGAGTFGRAAAFSFYPAKNLGACGEGGAVSTDDEGVADTVRMLRDQGQKSKYCHAAEGYNARLHALQAALLALKLPHVPAWNAARAEIARYYDGRFSRCDWIRAVTVMPHNRSSYHLYVIHVAQRDAMMAHLGGRKVSTGMHYPIPLHLQECYAHLGLGPGSFPHAERSARELISLPLFPELGRERAAYVADSVLAFGS